MADDTSYLQDLYSGVSDGLETSINSDTASRGDIVNDSSGGGDGVDLGPLTGVADVLKTFGNSPAGFILGAVLSELLGGIEVLLTALLDAVLFVFVGSGPGTTGMLGIADIPIFATEILIGATSGIGQTILELIGSLLGMVGTVAASAGPAAPLVVAGSIAVVAIAGAWTLRTVIDVVADAVPGLQGIIK